MNYYFAEIMFCQSNHGTEHGDIFTDLFVISKQTKLEYPATLHNWSWAFFCNVSLLGKNGQNAEENRKRQSWVCVVLDFHFSPQMFWCHPLVYNNVCPMSSHNCHIYSSYFYRSASQKCSLMYSCSRRHARGEVAGCVPWQLGVATWVSLSSGHGG